jgi:hypothetical protein
MGFRDEQDRMKRSIMNSIAGDEPFDMTKACGDPGWRTVTKSKWMSKDKFFLIKKADKPCWTPRGAGLGDGCLEPHILDDKRQIIDQNPKDECRSALCPTTIATRNHAIRHMSSTNSDYPTDFKKF